MHSNHRSTKTAQPAIGVLATPPRRYQGVSARDGKPESSRAEVGALCDTVVDELSTRNPALDAQWIGNAQVLQDEQRQIAQQHRKLHSPAPRAAADLQRILQYQAILIAIITDGMTYTVQFRSDSAHLSPHYQDDLKQFAQSLVMLRDLPFHLTVHLTGHTDPRGSSPDNLELSQRRVEVVRAYLLHSGLPDACIERHAVGEQAAMAKQGDAEGRFFDRRVHLSVSLAVLPMRKTTNALDNLLLPSTQETTS